MTPTDLVVDLPNVTVAAHAWGPPEGPLALLLHGFPDTAWTWRHLGPALADHGFRAVAPYLRGYAPTSLPRDGVFQVGALARDAVELVRALGADDRAVLVGHDWGAAAAYGAVNAHPTVFRRLVAMALPPPSAIRQAVGGHPGLLPRQVRNSWYVLLAQAPWLAERLMPHAVDRLWRDWSPGYDATEDVQRFLESVAVPRRMSAALGYYRATLQPWRTDPEYRKEEEAWLQPPTLPTLYLHGAQDGALRRELAGPVSRLLSPSSRAEVIAHSGHFLHLEHPSSINKRIVEFLLDAS